MSYQQENHHEILEAKNGKTYLICVTEYKGTLLDFQICGKFGEEWCEVCPPLPFTRKEVELFLQAERESLEQLEGSISAAEEAYRDFRLNQQM